MPGVIKQPWHDLAFQPSKKVCIHTKPLTSLVPEEMPSMPSNAQTEGKKPSYTANRGKACYAWDHLSDQWLSTVGVLYGRPGAGNVSRCQTQGRKFCKWSEHTVILANVVKVRQRGNFSSSRVGGSGGSNEVDGMVEGVGDGCLVLVLVVFL